MSFLTNHFRLSAKTIAEIYKARWQVELFFKWIKQNLKIKSFVGTSKNAVMTQIWIALCTYFVVGVPEVSVTGEQEHAADPSRVSAQFICKA